MDIAFFSTKKYDEDFFREANESFGHKLHFYEPNLVVQTAAFAREFPAVCVFVNDDLGADVLEILAQGKTRLIALRCAGFNNVDLEAAERLGMKVVRVPAYSPYAVAEHVFALLLTLVRKTHRAYNRVREGNFSLDGLIGFDLNEKTVGIIGTGKIGALTAERFLAFGCRVLAYDVYPSEELAKKGIEYVEQEELFRLSDIISLHCPLMKATHHLIDEKSLDLMKDGVTIINTSRGGLIDTEAAYRALKSGKIKNLGLDVYEEEGPLFFEDHSSAIIQDDLFMRLTTFPNVLVTGHQAFLTDTALQNIAQTTLENIRQYAAGATLKNEVKL
jgi:D-lactate dehydrogenase